MTLNSNVLVEEKPKVYKTVQEFFDAYPTSYGNSVRPHVKCKDGTMLSIQASSGHYCRPRADNAEEYSHVELMSSVKIRVFKAKDVGGVYAMVPVDVLDRVLKRHGYIIEVKEIR